MTKRPEICILALAALLSAACSTTRTLAPDQNRLAKNEIIITDDKHYPVSDLTPYLKQQANSYFIFGWNPFLCMYNWSTKEKSFWHKLGVPPVVFNEGMVGGSEENITNHLWNKGYYHASVKGTSSVQKQLARVKYEVTLGQRIPIEKIVYELPAGQPGSGHEILAKEFYADTTNSLVKRGAYLSSDLLESESTRSSIYLQNKSFYSLAKGNYFFTADTTSIPGKAILHYGIKNHVRGVSEEESIDFEQYKFGDVTISIPKTLRFREKILKDYNLIKPGDPYSNTVVANTYMRLSSMKVFNSINIELTQSDSVKNEVNCSITMKPSEFQGFKANLEGSFTSTGLFGIEPKLNFYHKNIFGGGEWMDVGFTGNFQFRPSDHAKAIELGANLGFSFPRPVLLPMKWFKGANVPRTEVKMSYNFQNRPEFTRHITSASAGYHGKIKKNLRFQFNPIQLNLVYLKNMSDSFVETLSKNPQLYYSYSDHIDAGAGGLLYYTTNLDLVPKSTYHYHKVLFDISGNVISLFNPLMPTNIAGQRTIGKLPYAQYVRAEYNFGNTWFFGKKSNQSIAMRTVLAAGFAYGNSSALPFEKQFYAGGASSMRGWQSRSLGPGNCPMSDAFVIPSQSGDMKFELDLEYRARLFWKVEGAVFAECGNIYTLQNDKSEDGSYKYNTRFCFEDFYKYLAADWGIGIRFNLDFIVLRLDLGMRIFDPAREESLRWMGPDRWFTDGGYAIHFGVGYPF